MQPTIQLTAPEEALFSVLVAAGEAGGTTVRVAGGWVRDKALGRQTFDVDVALDNCSGVAFAKHITKMLRERGIEHSATGVVAANPEQSKHLETATMRICGLEVDIVNLRCETYADESRIPTMEFGTPEQDALRRDFTINALFYNLHTKAIEDLTKHGLTDLAAGLLRTPLEPRVTLLDDPLRALRGVRFHARYGFAFDEALRAAASSKEVRAALLAKVSRERVGKEIRQRARV
ncbi:hypothetical protein M885DRAFT_430467 [Pelagophyceae sp. CCMP2097]|nr:hypothetical protein M885DRAFT_430467 [Pelagophyceae sp. CCMP2097]